MNLLRLICSAVSITFSCGWAYASPTSADYAVCHRKEALTLQMCLDRQGSGESPDCWVDGRGANECCYANVRRSYAPDKKRADAMRRAHAGAAAKRP